MVISREYHIFFILSEIVLNNCGNIISIDKQDDFEAFELWYKNYLFYKKNAEKNALNVLDFFSANNLALLYKESFEKALKDLR